MHLACCFFIVLQINILSLKNFATICENNAHCNKISNVTNNTITLLYSLK